MRAITILLLFLALFGLPLAAGPGIGRISACRQVAEHSASRIPHRTVCNGRLCWASGRVERVYLSGPFREAGQATFAANGSLAFTDVPDPGREGLHVARQVAR